MRLKFTCKPRKGLGLFASLFASQLSFQLSTLSSLGMHWCGIDMVWIGVMHGGVMYLSGALYCDVV